MDFKLLPYVNTIFNVKCCLFFFLPFKSSLVIMYVRLCSALKVKTKMLCAPRVKMNTLNHSATEELISRMLFNISYLSLKPRKCCVLLEWK